MQRRNLKKRIQKSVALASMAAFLTMPGSLVHAATSITAGNSAIGSATGIATNGNTTTITTNFINGGTGINHFNNFNVGSGHTANFIGANKYVNLIDTRANINGIVNMFKGNANGGYANAMFISPEGMAIGAGGVLNVGSLQMVTPSTSDFNNILSKASVAGLSEEQVNGIFDINKINASSSIISIDGQIMSLGDVVIKAGDGIYFGPQGIIDTTGELVDGAGNISLFVNDGEIMGGAIAPKLDEQGNVIIDKDGEKVYGVNLKAKGDISLDAVGIAGQNENNVGVREDIESEYGKVALEPFRVQVGEGKTLNVKVADTMAAATQTTGQAVVSVQDVMNLNVGDIQGANISITNKGVLSKVVKNNNEVKYVRSGGTLSTTKDINSVDKLYLNSQNGGLDVSNDITAKNIVRLNGKVYVDATGKLATTDAGYISVYSQNGDVSVNDATLKSGSIDIKSVAGDVEIGNITIAERGPAEGALRLENNEKLSTGVVAPDMFRPDGVFVEATNGQITQLGGTQITSAGKVDLTAGKSVNAVVKAHDMISAHSNGEVNLDLLDTSRLGEVKSSVLKVLGDEILVDGMIDAGVVDIVAIDKVVVRPRLALDEANGHYTYGAIKGVADVNIASQNGIFATSEKTDAPMISSKAGNVNLSTVGDIGDGIKISVAASEAVNAEAANVNLLFTGDNGNAGKIVASEYVDIIAQGNLNRVGENAIIKAGEDMNLVSNNGNVGAADNYLNVEVGGLLDAQAPNGGVYINSDGALSVLNAVAGTDIGLSSSETLTISRANAGEDVVISAGKDVSAATIKAVQDVEISAKGNVDVANNIQAGNDLTVEADGYIHQTLDNKTAFKSGENMTLKSAKDNVGDPNKYLNVEVGGLLDAAAPNGGVYIYGNSDLNVLNAIAGTDVSLKSPNNITISKAQAGNNVEVTADKNIVAATIKAANDANIDALGDVTVGNLVEAGNNIVIEADGNIHQSVDGKLSFKSGKDMTLNSANKNVGDPNKYLHVQVGEALNAEALNGGVYIAGVGNLNVDKVQAGKDVALKSEGNLHQIAQANPEDPRIISGENMKLEAGNINVGDPENYLQVKVGGQLDAAAPNGGVYIGSKDNLTIGQVAAGKDVEIVADGFIHQTDNGVRPAIIAGEDLKLLSKADNVGDPNNYLTVQVGDKLNAQAPNGGVYIYGYGDLVTDTVIAGGDIGLGGNGDIIIPHDKVDGNIIAGGNVKIEAGDSVVNAGGTEVGIVAGGDIDVSANHNLKDGSVGKLPYNDLAHSINVTLNGEVRADEIGVADANKILNIHIMGQESSVVPDNDGTIELDDRDQRNMKYLASDDNNSASVRNNRQHLRYNVNNSEYLLMNSSTESGAKVQDVLNISKQGMLVQTDEVVKVGETIKVTMDYKGLPFTVEGKVVRTDAVNKTAGIEFINVDKMTSSLILYLGMMNGR